ncbi:hypothetical protein M8542_20095 [Amycolatopsis sp. OK19-0408]|uniref:Uncharacterized protein n=1 Tax=Amycolatopsis iheyensis TaxID=2945988 RepID=A0A9X2NE12_9PSEU|nr:hypothetical protein [Amycolatopsis iheyensis]MCR6485135.1 hypothetical protein [Amycolatopsis iheyensis]
MDDFLEHASRAYGDLRKPGYAFFEEALRTRPWEPLVERLRQVMRVEDWTDREDDVSFSYVLDRSRHSEAWLLWLSAVGPFALLVHAPAPAAEPMARSGVITGVRLLSAEEVETTVDFAPAGGRFPASLFVLLFGDSDVPWWHAH